MKIRLSGHSAYCYRILYSMDTQISLPYPKAYPTGYLRKFFPKIIRNLLGCEITEYNIEVVHIHMVMIILTSYKVSEIVGRIKS